MPEIAAFICSHVFENTRPILLVAREDGDWMFLCGAEHPEDEQYEVVGMNHLLDRDASLRELLDLPDNWEASRDVSGAQWKRALIDD